MIFLNVFLVVSSGNLCMQGTTKSHKGRLNAKGTKKIGREERHFSHCTCEDVLPEKICAKQMGAWFW